MALEKVGDVSEPVLTGYGIHLILYSADLTPGAVPLEDVREALTETALTDAQQAAYSASKHALLGMTKSLAKEVYKEGIRVHMISPGGVYTDMVKIARPDLDGEDMIQPEEVAEQVAFLMAHRGSAVVDEIRMHRAGKEPFGK